MSIGHANDALSSCFDTMFVRLAGGLGNQLFQIAAATLCHMGNNRSIQLSANSLKNYKTPRSFDVPLVLKLPNWFRLMDHSSRWDRVAIPILESRIGRWSPLMAVSDRNFSKITNSLDKQMLQPRWLDGYFQNGWTHASFASVRIQLLDWVKPELSIRNHSESDCVMHIRGGDFLLSNKHNVLTHTYYQTAINLMRAQLGSAMRWTCITDDLVHANSIIQNLCKVGLGNGFDGFTCSANLTTDFALLRNANSRIIGNSTFAWWASALDTQCSPTLSPTRWATNQSRPPMLNHETGLSTC